MYRILIIEDDATISTLLGEHLRKWNYDTYQITDFKNILNKVVEYEPHLLLLDIMLPYYNGFYWCGEIRKLSQTPIIFISSAADNMNIIMAMNMGGDDFIIKPFDINVLIAKIQAILRRTYSFQNNVNLIEHNEVILNLNETTLIYNDEKIDLTKNEYRIIQVLMENIGKVISRNEIIERLWDDDSFIDDNTLTVNITRLRKKLNDVGLNDFIKTKKGLGYIID